MPWQQTILYACVAFLAGAGAASLVKISSILFLFGAAMAVFLFISGLAARNHRLAVGGILLLFFIFGFWRFEFAWQKIENNDLAKINDNPMPAGFIGMIKNDPVFGQSSQQLIFKPDGIDGKILVIAGRYPEYRYGDRIKFFAALEEPESFNGFDYPNYLAKSGIYSTVRYPKIELVSRSNGNYIYGALIWIKHRLETSVQKSLPSPHSALLSAILFGDQTGLDGCSAKEIEADPDCAKLKEKLNISGLRHLSAVSGTHITIMAMVIAPFLIWLGFWRRKALWLTIVFVWSFVLMIGLPASAVRAGIMGSLMILAQIIGRPADMLRIVTIAAVFMIWQNPLILRFDIGFQLSFLAVVGMALFCGPIQRRIGFVKPEFIKSALATALAAQIFTLPVLVYNFGYMSTYSLIANILVEPTITFITIYGFVMAIAGAIIQGLGWLLMAPMWLALSYLLTVANIFSGLPWAKIAFQIDFAWFLITYILLVIIAWRIKEKEQFDFLKN